MTKPLFTCLLLWSVAVGSSLAGPLFNRVAAFQAGPTAPENGSLLKHSDGFFYGTSASGGAYGKGCLYRISSSGQMTALVHFAGSTGLTRGSQPQAELVDDGSGVLWGTTFRGGSGNSGDGFGTVFRYNPATTDFASVVEFSGTGGFAKGSFPQSGLVPDGTGKLWGTTSGGGVGGNGTIFRINSTNLVFTTVLDFTGTAGANRGKSPMATLVRDGSGTLWGTTSEGGSGSRGTLFSFNPATAALTTRVDFTGSAGAFAGSDPGAALVEGAGGTWWGTTRSGGALGFGTVFTFKSGNGVFTKIADFTGTAGALPGRTPSAALVADGAGGFYGTTNAGGASDSGTIFRINGSTSAVSAIHLFTGKSGALPGTTPYSSLVADGAGFLWGVTKAGGSAGLGTTYKINATSGTCARVTDFVPTLGPVPGSNPISGLTAGPGGLLWGTTEKGGAANAGTIYTLDPATGNLESVLEFTGTAGVAKGTSPSAELVSDGIGSFWGVTGSGGSLDSGMVFKINQTTKAYTIVSEFTGPDGRNPKGRLVSDGAGYFWGTTADGGANNNGTVFKISMVDGVLTTVLHFTGTSGSFIGDSPFGGLTNDGAGFLWGTTYEGGRFNRGSIFKIAVASGAFTNMFSFDGDGSFPGDGPNSSLTADAAGNLWGVTEFGGADYLGTVYKISRSNGVVTSMVSFSGIGGNQPGSFPKSSLVQDSAGAWYGSTESGGANDLGTVFRISAAGNFQSLADFSGPLGNFPGAKPQGNLFSHTDGHLYATTSGGGTADGLIPGGNGGVYRLRFGPIPVTGTASPVETTTATLTASVNPNGAATQVSFEYGTSATLAAATIVSAGTTGADSVPVTMSASLTGLQASSRYYYRVRALNPENANLQLGAILSFTTAAGSGGGPGGGNTGFSLWLSAAGVNGGAAEAATDSDFDGTPNALEYIQGTSPVIRNPRTEPEIRVAEGNLVFTFQRVDSSESADVTLRVEVGSDLTGSTSFFVIGNTTAASSGGVSVEENGEAPDTITVRIPMLSSRTQFARLRVIISP